jgi:cell division protein FtsZ
MKPRIAVVGVGGAGGNAINNMIAAGLTGAQFMVANTDAQALAASSASCAIQLGSNLTEGLGAGSKPEIGEQAAEEALDEIRAAISGCHMVFVAAGMGGGTGTGAASVIARVAKEFDILTVAVVTKPFQFEGSRRMRVAEAGIAELRQHVDTLLVIPNQNLFRVATDRTTFAEAFVLADQVLYSGIACIVDLIVKEGLINLDLADVRTVLSGMGTAMMGTGEAAGEQRAIVAAEEAIVNPLLDDVTLKGAKSLLLSITGGHDPDLCGRSTRRPIACARRSIPTPTSSSAPPSIWRSATACACRSSLRHGRSRAPGAQHSGRAKAAPGRARRQRAAPDDYRRRRPRRYGHRSGRAPSDPTIAGRLSPRFALQRVPRMAPRRRREARRHGSAHAGRGGLSAGRPARILGKIGDANGGSVPELDQFTSITRITAPKTSLLRRLTEVVGARDTPPASVPRADDSDHRLSPQLAEDNVDLPVFFGRKKR